MPTEKLTARRVETARAGEEGRLDLRDSEAKGLVLRVQTRGPKVWRFEYKGRRLDPAGNPVGLSNDPERRKKQLGDDQRPIWESRVMILGEADSISLEKARSEALALRHKLSQGIDPILEAKKAAAASVEENRRRHQAITLRQLLERRLGKPAASTKQLLDGTLGQGSTPESPPEDTSLGPNTIDEYRAMMRRDIYNSLVADLPASEVSADAISDILDGIEARSKDGGGKRAADLVKTVLSSSYRWAVKKRLLRTNPLRDVPKRATKRARKRVPSKAEVIAIWSALKHEKTIMSEPMRQIVRIAILTGQRRSEVASVRRADIYLQGKATTHDGHEVNAPVWIIPGDVLVKGRVVFGVTKNGLEQVVPLSHQAAAIFKEVIDLSIGDYLFPTWHTAKRGSIPKRPHIHEDSVTKAMCTLRMTHNIHDVTVHDMRRAITTAIGDAGFRPDILDRVLNHKRTGVTAEHYDFSRMLPDVRSALQTWADSILPPGTPTSTI